MYYIYLIINNLNGKKYIGQRKADFNYHPSNDGYMGSCESLKKDIKKYGKKYFSKIILEICETKKQIEQSEKKYLNLNNVKRRDDFYNQCLSYHSNADHVKQTKKHIKYLNAKLEEIKRERKKIKYLKEKLSKHGFSAKVNMDQVYKLLGIEIRNGDDYSNVVFLDFNKWVDFEIQTEFDILGCKSIEALESLGFFNELNY